jgi:5-methylcytosine-specific restriction endonuclease McrA
LLERGRARVTRRTPFQVQLLDREQEDCVLQPILIKIDPGSKASGIAVVRDEGVYNDLKPSRCKHTVLHLMELQHRGWQIKKKMAARAAFRKRRRSKLRYRQARFNNRAKAKGTLPPSLQHRVDSTMSQVNRICQSYPVTGIAVERNRFDTQLMQNPDISGVEYQQGTLAGTEVREYLLEKHKRTCVYCGKKDVPFNIDHINPRSKGGSDRVSNLTLSCVSCNKKKDNMLVEEFVKDKEKLKTILAQTKAPLRNAAMMNATRYALYDKLRETGLPVEASTGGRTKWNRGRFGIPKSHALDAACVGQCEEVKNWQQPTLEVKAMGRGSYQRTRIDKYGFSVGYCMRKKRVHGFATGDIVRAEVIKRKKIGTYVGRVAVRETGSFNITTGDKVVEGIGYKNCRLLQRADGYAYYLNTNKLLPDLKVQVSA